MQKRIVRRTVTNIAQLPADWHPVLRRIYAARGITSAAQLDYSLARLHPWQSLAGIDSAVALLHDALRSGKHVLIVGDFDADGATSTALAILGLRALGADNVGYLVPNRFEFGYGLTPEIVTVAAKRQPDLLITVDNGIASCAGVDLARSLGIKVLVTDHHLPGQVLPEADAIVNPNQPGCSFPSKALAGVGVMFYVLLALRARLRESAWFQGTRSEPNLAALLDLVALGTVADVVPLDYNNRILVQQGLARMRAGHCRPGLQALAEIAGRDLGRIDSADLGFALGPRLNAAGRLTDMSLGIECLLAEHLPQARELARKLHLLNQQRREIEASMHEQALGITAVLHGESDPAQMPAGMCLYDAEWHQGVIGILASRMREHLHRPVIAFARGSGNELKGSARSIPNVHIRDILEAIATSHPGLLTKFGGHAMAAGVTLNACDLPLFTQMFANEIAKHVTSDDLHGIVFTDGELDVGDLDVNLAESLRYGGPWGQTFAEPVFDGIFELVGSRTIADKHLKLLLRRPAAGGPPLEAMAFNGAAQAVPPNGGQIKLAYRLTVNEYLGRRSPQLIVEPGVSLTT